MRKPSAFGLLARQRLGVSGFGYGLLLTAVAAGSLAGGLVAGRVVDRLGRTGVSAETPDAADRRAVVQPRPAPPRALRPRAAAEVIAVLGTAPHRDITAR